MKSVQSPGQSLKSVRNWSTSVYVGYTLFVILLLALFVGMFMLMSSWNQPSLTDCPNVLLRRENRLLLLNTRKPTVEGVNPIVLNSLDDYVSYAKQQQQILGQSCPILFVQQEENDPHGKPTFSMVTDVDPTSIKLNKDASSVSLKRIPPLPAPSSSSGPAASASATAPAPAPSSSSGPPAAAKPTFGFSSLNPASESSAFSAFDPMGPLMSTKTPSSTQIGPVPQNSIGQVAHGGYVTRTSTSVPVLPLQLNNPTPPTGIPTLAFPYPPGVQPPSVQGGGGGQAPVFQLQMNNVSPTMPPPTTMPTMPPSPTMPTMPTMPPPPTTPPTCPPIPPKVPVPYVDASRDDPPFNQNMYSGFDPHNMYAGVYTTLDVIRDSTKQGTPFSDNAMDPNWGGVQYTKAQINSGKYDDNIVSTPVYSTSPNTFMLPTFRPLVDPTVQPQNPGQPQQQLQQQQQQQQRI